MLFDLRSSSAFLPSGATLDTGSGGPAPQVGDVFRVIIDGVETWWRIVPFGNGARRVIGITSGTGAIGRVACEPDTPPAPAPH